MKHKLNGPEGGQAEAVARHGLHHIAYEKTKIEPFLAAALTYASTHISRQCDAVSANTSFESLRCCSVCEISCTCLELTIQLLLMISNNKK